MRLAIRHTTRYDFGAPVTHGLQRLRLTPKTTQGQEIIEWSMEYEGASAELEYEDQNHNRVTLIAVEPGIQQVTVTCRGKVDTEDKAGVIGRHAGHLPLWSFLSQTPLTQPGPRVKALTGAIDASAEDTVAMLHDLSRKIIDAVVYQTGETGVDTTAEDAMVAGKGVCQDHAHIFIGAARAMDIPARYISGYLMMDDRVEQEATHAWAEAHVAGLGWVGFDVSNGISPDARYVRVATGRDYNDASPITGISFGSAESHLHVELAVEQQTVEQ